MTDYGGTLPSLADLDDPLCAGGQESPYVRPPSKQLQQQQLSPSFVPLAPYLVLDAPSIARISPTSALNPFFGYPIQALGGSPSLHHGRRRKRDLIRTLGLLFWVRWRRPISTCLWLFVVALTVRGARSWFLRSSRGLSVWKVFLSSAVPW